jgi:alpha-beta hydrolase superfamily lysophospholipase
MKRGVKIVIALLLLVIVAAVLISPAVDLQPTALRSAIWSAALFAAIAALTFAFSRFRPVLLRERVLLHPLHRTPNLIPVTDLDCVRRC